MSETTSVTEKCEIKTQIPLNVVDILICGQWEIKFQLNESKEQMIVQVKLYITRFICLSFILRGFFKKNIIMSVE